MADILVVVAVSIPSGVVLAVGGALMAGTDGFRAAMLGYLVGIAQMIFWRWHGG